MMTIDRDKLSKTVAHAIAIIGEAVPDPNGQTEGHNTKLTVVKRQMQGRASLDPLKARLLGAT